MVIQGAGFSRLAQYKCVFTGRGLLYEKEVTLALFSSPTRLSCLSPRSQGSIDLGMDMTAEMSITEDNNQIPFTENQRSAYFTYTALGWTSATPIQSDVTGGKLLTIQGTGFKSTGFLYDAVFSAGPYRATSICQTSCPALTCFTLKCRIPSALADLSLSLEFCGVKCVGCYRH